MSWMNHSMIQRYHKNMERYQTFALGNHRHQ